MCRKRHTNWAFGRLSGAYTPDIAVRDVVRAADERPGLIAVWRLNHAQSGNKLHPPVSDPCTAITQDNYRSRVLRYGTAEIVTRHARWNPSK